MQSSKPHFFSRLLMQLWWIDHCPGVRYVCVDMVMLTTANLGTASKTSDPRAPSGMQGSLGHRGSGSYGGLIKEPATTPCVKHHDQSTLCSAISAPEVFLPTCLTSDKEPQIKYSFSTPFPEGVPHCPKAGEKGCRVLSPCLVSRTCILVKEKCL